jgi:hypothetical protein
MRTIARLGHAAPVAGARTIRGARVVPRPPQARRRTLRAVSASATAADGPSSTTQRILERLEQREAYNSDGAGGAGAGMTLAALRRVDDVWHRVRTMPEGEAAGPKPQVHADVPTRPTDRLVPYHVLPPRFRGPKAPAHLPLRVGVAYARRRLRCASVPSHLLLHAERLR